MYVYCIISLSYMSHGNIDVGIKCWSWFNLLILVLLRPRPWRHEWKGTDSPEGSASVNRKPKRLKPKVAQNEGAIVFVVFICVYSHSANRHLKWTIFINKLAQHVFGRHFTTREPPKWRATPCNTHKAACQQKMLGPFTQIRLRCLE